MKVAFDVDDTLIVPAIVANAEVDVPNYDTIAIYKWFQRQGNEMIVWSGSGSDYAERWADKLGLNPYHIRIKQKYNDVDIAFDDCDVDLGKVNIKVKRIKNYISREEWNKTK